MVVAYDIRGIVNSKVPSASFEILTLQGQIVEKILLANYKDQFVLSMGEYKPAIYIASLKVQGKLIESRKFTIIHP